MTATNKQSLISESVAVIQINIHPSGQEPDQHVIRVAPTVSRTTIVCEVPTKLKSGLCSRDEVLAPSDVRPSHHPGLLHSPSNKPPLSREGWFDKVVTGLLGLLGPIKPNKWSLQIKACHRGQNDAVLNPHMRGLPPWNLRISTAVFSPFPSEWSTFPYLSCPVTFTIREHNHSLYSSYPSCPSSSWKKMSYLQVGPTTHLLLMSIC
jgi:hypothetical protein